ncbi:TetR/AcrR family transcriptional regulator C-terminal domain-containing protein [Ammonicoccus fulvus]|uniref:TetR/AcrR family transcriptional regulator C-terminal domain-containing protein n=1 Tax=Ammonicoccus fulvus TaxID=3138240 RepID=A0ABZ3FJX8_9ACTN
MDDGFAGSRRGRPRAGERAGREDAIIDAALAELAEVGWDRFTMAGAARRAGASTETLYAWFGNRDGLIRRMVQRNADLSAAVVHEELRNGTGTRDLRGTLVAYARGLLDLLTGPVSLMLNRAAITQPELAEVLRSEGRLRIGPLVGRYLGERHAAGELHCPDPEKCFTVLYGLVVRDLQIGVLLGAERPDDAALQARAEEAVELFLRLHSGR